jgi:hypothetical protein
LEGLYDGGIVRGRRERCGDRGGRGRFRFLAVMLWLLGTLIVPGIAAATAAIVSLTFDVTVR